MFANIRVYIRTVGDHDSHGHMLEREDTADSLHPVKSVKSLYSVSLKIWGSVIKKLDPGICTWPEESVCFRVRGINGDDDNEYQKNLASSILDISFSHHPAITIVYNINAVEVHENKCKIIGEVWRM